MPLKDNLFRCMKKKKKETLRERAIVVLAWKAKCAVECVCDGRGGGKKRGGGREGVKCK